MADSFTEYENATEMPRVANPGAPEQMEPQPMKPKPQKTTKTKLKIRWDWLLTSLLIALLIPFFSWVYKAFSLRNSARTIVEMPSEQIVREKIIYKTAKPKIIYKTKWKDRIVYRDKVIVQEVSDTALLMKLKKENQILREKLAKQDKHLQLHKMAIRKFFKDPRSRKLSIETSRQYW